VVPGDTLQREMEAIKRKASVARMAAMATVDGVKPPETDA